MLQFILANVFMLSLGALLYLMVRALPRIEEEQLPPERKTFLDRFVMSEIPEKVDVAVNAYSEKLFRRLKVVLMRVDNIITERLKKISNGNGNHSTSLVRPGSPQVRAGGNGNGNGKPKADFIKEITAEKNGSGNGTH